MQEISEPLPGQLTLPVITRREVLLGGMLTLVFSRRAACHAVGQPMQGGGCLLSGNQLNTRFGANGVFGGDHPRVIEASGDRLFDRALAETLAMISDMFGVLPAFAYCDDRGAPNAYASSDAFKGRADGTVLFGIELLRQLMRGVTDHPDVAVAAVCAHEFGHIVQYKRSLTRQFSADRNVKRIELQADFLAGYFAGRRKLARNGFPAAVIALSQFNAGDQAFGSQQHHGTPEERGAAVEQGFLAAYDSKADLNSAIAISQRYLAR